MKALLLAAASFAVSCSGNTNNSQSQAQQGSSDTFNTTFQTPSPTPQPTANPDEAAGLVSRFYRDVNAQKISDIDNIVSADFLRAHNDDWVADYGWIQDPKLQVKSVNDRAVSYVLDYTYATTKGRLFWERSGTWTLNHGASSGWILDKDTWDSIHLKGLGTSPTGPMIPVEDTVYSDGRHEFDFMGERFSFLANNKTWNITAIGPAETAQATQAPTTVTVTTNGTSQTYSGTGSTHVYIPPTTTSASCDEASLQWKSEDGDWIGTDDGRKFHVMPGDESEVLTWTQSDDLKICGTTIIDIDDDGSQAEIY